MKPSDTYAEEVKMVFKYFLSDFTKIAVVAVTALITGCGGGGDGGSNIPIPKSQSFQNSLSSYNIFSGEMRQLTPASGFVLYELSSELFTDYASKQRLISVPEGSQVTKLSSGELSFPEGTMLVKTFYYPNNAEHALTNESQIVETRLLVKAQGEWNVATYVWNSQQTDAVLNTSGTGVAVKRVVNGTTQNINYEVPSEQDCVTCHQRSNTVSPIGPSILNLNRNIVRNGVEVAQFDHLALTGKFAALDPSTEPTMVNYKDINAPLSDRGRAYLAMNCSHCHNPEGWGRPASKGMDLRYQVPFAQSGIGNKKSQIFNVLSNGRMPYIGTTEIHSEGVGLIREYVNSL